MSADRPTAGVVVLAPHEFVEAKALVRSGAAGLFACSDWWRRLARRHHEAEAVFRSWRETWLVTKFADRDITGCLPAIRCPLPAIQGEHKEYATMRQIACVADAASEVRLLTLAHCRLSTQRDHPEAVIDAHHAACRAARQVAGGLTTEPAGIPGPGWSGYRRRYERAFGSTTLLPKASSP